MKALTIKRNKVSVKLILSLVGIIFLFVLVRWNGFNMPFERDEGEYAYNAWLLKRGSLPYEDDFLQKPPGIVYVYMLAQLIDQDAYWPPRLIAYLFTAGTILLVAWIAKKEYRRESGWVALWIATAMFSFPYVLPLTANTELFMLLPLVGVLALYVGKRTAANNWQWFWAGALACLALMFKPIALLPLVYIFLVWWFEVGKKNKFVPVVKAISFSALGGVLVAVLFLAPFILRGALASFWECVVLFNRDYLQSGNFGYHNALGFLGYFWKSWKPLFFLTAFFLIRWSKRAWFYFGLLLSSILMIYRSELGHYYLLLLPFWAIIVTGAIVDLAGVLLGGRKNKQRQLLVSIGVLLLVVSLVWPRREFLFMTSDELSWWMFGYATPFVEAKEFSKELVKVTDSEDYVFIVGAETEILYYAQRQSSSRFTIVYVLTMDTSRRLDYQHEAIEELRKRPPKAIVVSRTPTSGGWERVSPHPLLEYLDETMAQDYELLGGWVRNYRTDDFGYWQAPLEEGREEESSLLLYKRI